MLIFLSIWWSHTSFQVKSKSLTISNFHTFFMNSNPKSFMGSFPSVPFCCLNMPGASRSCVCACKVNSVVSDSVLPHGLYPARLLCPWDSPGKNTGVVCHLCLGRADLPLLGSPGPTGWTSPLRAHQGAQPP